MCLKTCNARINYRYNNKEKMKKATIYFRDHIHPVVNGIYRDSVEKILGLIAKQMAKTLIASKSAIALSLAKISTQTT